MKVVDVRLAEELEAMKAEYSEQGENEQLLSRIRQLDLHNRRSMIERLGFSRMGAYLLLGGLGPEKGKKYRELGEDSAEQFDSLTVKFRKAQRKVEKRHFRQRKAMMYFEKERKKMQRQMGQDPYLDTPG